MDTSLVGQKVLVLPNKDFVPSSPYTQAFMLPKDFVVGTISYASGSLCWVSLPTSTPSGNIENAGLWLVEGQFVIIPEDITADQLKALISLLTHD